MTSTSFSAHRQLTTKHSATDLVSSGSFASPLAQLSLSGSSVCVSFRSVNLAYNQFAGPSRLRDGPTPPPVPALSLNLFRTPSVYSVDSISSLSTISNDERAFNIESDGDVTPESPSTPRASMFQQEDYFSSNAAPSVPLTPKRGFAVTSRPQPSPGRQHIPQKTAATPAVHLTEKTVEPQQPEQAIVQDDLESLHGEQGLDWGDDEANFEWVDNDHGPVAANGDGKTISPSKRLGKTLRSAVAIGGGEGKRLRKNLVFPRRAAPPPPPNTAPSPAPPTFSPKITDGPLPPRPGDVVFPSPNLSQRPGLSQRWTDGSPAPSDLFTGPAKPPRPLPSPLMVPMRSEDGPNSTAMAGSGTRNSHMSMQSAAYSFYDIDSPGATTPRSSTPTSGTPKLPQDHAFPHGRYAKVSVSHLEQERVARERSASDPQRRGSPDEDLSSPEGLVARGIEARGLGDLAKSAWFFMKAAEKGSSTGRMYWGLALRHGWGVAKDSKRAFAELRQACDESLAGGGADFHQSPGAIKLTLHQRRALTRDLSLGMFEIANCFLEGVGGKKSPDVALSYLRFAGNLGDIAAQEQLGFLLSKGGSGIKKDMKEAAKWYRMAIGQGSTNTFGLAWVWKDKYMR